jgi:hypothetical protein
MYQYGVRTHCVPSQYFTGFVAHVAPDHTFTGLATHAAPVHTLICPVFPTTLPDKSCAAAGRIG